LAARADRYQKVGWALVNFRIADIQSRLALIMGQIYKSRAPVRHASRWALVAALFLDGLAPCR